MKIMNAPEHVAVVESDDSFAYKISDLLAKRWQDCVCTQFKTYNDFCKNRLAFDTFVFNENSYLLFLQDKPLSDAFADSSKRSYMLTDKNGKSKAVYLVSRQSSVSPEDLTAKIEALEDEFLKELFLKLGFRHNLTGCRYLKAAIKLASHDSSYLNKGITKRLYPDLAVRFGTNAGSIERGIRHALGVCFDNGKFRAQSSVFGNCFDNSHCPTNGEFIAVVADMMSTKIKSSFSVEKQNIYRC